jgi:pimeloyl-ACP methyl ester carboxylesterase
VTRAIPVGLAVLTAAVVITTVAVRADEKGPPAAPKAADSSVQLETKTGTLHGTIDMPAGAGPFPVVVFIAGSGPTDRDGNQPRMKNDSLKMLGRGLAARGIAAVRYDRRGIGASVAAQRQEETLRFEMLADDAAAWVALLRKDRRFGRVGIAGHSEGSLLGMLAARRAKADAFVSLAGPGRDAATVLREQLGKNLPPDLKAKSDRIIDELVSGRTVADVPPELAALFRPGVQPYLISLLKYDPAREIVRLDVPILVVQGTTDLQETVGDARRLAAAKRRARLSLIEGMNHVLKHATTPAEQQAAYFDRSVPLEPKVVEEVAAFLGEALRRR